jgi:translocation protein SEC63
MNLTTRTKLLVLGWALFGFLSYKMAGAKATNSVYNPFEILGINMSATEKEIKSHYKKLSKVFHPDKVKLKVNETIEAAESYFVELTKAYKALTNEEIRENVRKWGHPDGRRDVSMGIAIPPWVIEGKNNLYVLGLYGLLFGGALPALVGRWWFGNRQKTKDGVQATSAAAFFKSIREDSSLDDVVVTLTKAYQFETTSANKTSTKEEVLALDKSITEHAGSLWSKVKKSNGGCSSTPLVLLFAHLLRLPVQDSRLQQEQSQILLQTPTLLNALLNITTARNWLMPSLAVMRLHGYITQGLLPGQMRSKWAQLPGISSDESLQLSSSCSSADELAQLFREIADPRASDVTSASQVWRKLEIVDATFKVIGERIVVPSSFVFLLVKLRLSAPGGKSAAKLDELDAEQTKKAIKHNDEIDDDFLDSKKDMEDMPDDENSKIHLAHTPHWPASRKPSWWLVLADDKSNRIVVPPMKITDVPVADPNKGEHDRNYRSYKIQFQAPPNTGLFTWKVYLISDTYVDDDVTRSITLKIDDVSALTADETAGVEDEISEPEEDTLAGQMAALRGDKVKEPGVAGGEGSDEDSDTDGDESDSSSDSDSD